jgi:hypothetical protein
MTNDVATDGPTLNETARSSSMRRTQLIELFGWSSALRFMVAGTPLVGVGWMDLCDHSMARSD